MGFRSVVLSITFIPGFVVIMDYNRLMIFDKWMTDGYFLPYNIFRSQAIACDLDTIILGSMTPLPRQLPSSIIYIYGI